MAELKLAELKQLVSEYRDMISRSDDVEECDRLFAIVEECDRQIAALEKEIAAVGQGDMASKKLSDAQNEALQQLVTGNKVFPISFRGSAIKPYEKLQEFGFADADMVSDPLYTMAIEYVLTEAGRELAESLFGGNDPVDPAPTDASDSPDTAATREQDAAGDTTASEPDDVLIDERIPDDPTVKRITLKAGRINIVTAADLSSVADDDTLVEWIAEDAVIDATIDERIPDDPTVKRITLKAGRINIVTAADLSSVADDDTLVEWIAEDAVIDATIDELYPDDTSYLYADFVREQYARADAEDVTEMNPQPATGSQGAEGDSRERYSVAQLGDGIFVVADEDGSYLDPEYPSEEAAQIEADTLNTAAPYTVADDDTGAGSVADSGVVCGDCGKRCEPREYFGNFCLDCAADRLLIAMGIELPQAKTTRFTNTGGGNIVSGHGRPSRNRKNSRPVATQTQQAVCIPNMQRRTQGSGFKRKVAPIHVLPQMTRTLERRKVAA
jgi:hypothetical protein